MDGDKTLKRKFTSSISFRGCRIKNEKKMKKRSKEVDSAFS
ncbi:MAG: hypothetical protein AB3K77_06745 [Methanosarcinaceae archaeon]